MEARAGGKLSNESVQESLHDESYVAKRDASSMDDPTSKTAKKKRRSSLCSRRRSIVRDEVPASDVLSTDSESQGSLPSSSEGKTSQNDEEKPVANPINLRLDEMISQMELKISSLNKECARWKEIVKELQDREEETKLLASNLILPSSDVPDFSKEMALTQYITCRPLDLSAVAAKVQGLLAKCQFDREACVQDVRLVAESIDALHNAAEIKASLLSGMVNSSAFLECEQDPDGTSSSNTNSKKIVQNVIDQ